MQKLVLVKEKSFTIKYFCIFEFYQLIGTYYTQLSSLKSFAKYFFFGIAIVAVAFLLWYFSSIVAYILVSAVLSLMGKPIVSWLLSLQYKGRRFPAGLAAAIGLLTLWSFFFLFFRLMIPLIVGQFNELGSIDVDALVNAYSSPINDVQQIFHRFLPANAQSFSLQEFLTEKISGLFSINMVTGFFSSTANIIISLCIALFSVSFITFFFLKDDDLFYNGVLLLFPTKWEKQIGHALSSVGKLLRRYFIGIVAESICITILNTIWLSIIGIRFETSIVIGFIAGILNVVPYVGPLVGVVFGVLISIATNFSMPFQNELLPMIIWVLVAMCSTQVVDNILLQPVIYGNSVKAHPLEIFIVLLVAGNVAGILGMLLAIPSYTVLRVFAKEFFFNFKVVKKLTQNM